MRCLYCGNELALFRKLTGGGEFCSEAHRQKYQEEYNRLALSRLLQTQQPEPERKPIPPKEPAKEVKAPPPAPKTPPPAVRPVAAPVLVMRAPEPQPEPPPKPRQPEKPREIEITAPAPPAGFFLTKPGPATAKLGLREAQATTLVRNAAPTLPTPAHREGSLALAVAVPIARASVPTLAGVRASVQPDESPAREFDHPHPAAGLSWTWTTGQTGWNSSKDPMETLIFAKPPQATARAWTEPEKRFAPRAAQFLEWTRLDLATTGLEPDEAPALAHIPVPPRVEVAAPPEPTVTPGSALAELSKLHQVLVEEAPEAERAAEESIPEVIEEPVAVAPEVVEEPEVETPKKEVTPRLATQPLAIELAAVSPDKARPVQVHTGMARAEFKIQQPRLSSLPLRPLMVFGPAPAPATVVEKPAEKVAPTKPEPPKPVPGKPKVEVKAAPQKPRRPEVKISEPPPAVSPAPREPEKKPVAAVKEPATPAEPVLEKPKEAPAEKAKPVERKPPTPEAKPVAAEPAPAISDLDFRLRLQPSDSRWSRLSGGVKVVAIAAVLGAIGLVGYLMKGGPNGTAATGGTRVVDAGPALLVGEGGWSMDWLQDAPGTRRTRQVSIFRPSLTLADYRIEFQGQIDTKAIGWVFRAQNPKNFYVMKLEIVKAGLEPMVAVIRHATLDGEEQPRAQFPLPIKTRLDTVYKVRMEVVGKTFTTWVQDQKVDTWTDDQIKSGGVGLYSERGERAQIRGVAITPLALRN